MNHMKMLTLVSCVFAATAHAQSTAYAPSQKLSEGRQIVAVYIGADNCGPCKLPEIKEAVERMKFLVRGQAGQSGASFAVIGVANDWDTRVAASFIATNGAFDQVVLGGNFGNLAIEQFVSRDPDGRSVMPQIVVVERTAKSGTYNMEFSEPRVLRRLRGSEEIPTWVKQGAPISPISKP